MKRERFRDRSARFDRVTALLPQLQGGLPVASSYKLDVPSLDGGIGVYDVVAYAGDASAMTPDAITLPNDEDLQLEKGTRRLQLRNAMRVNFDLMTVAVAASVIAADQRGHVDFEAYFAFVMLRLMWLHDTQRHLGIMEVAPLVVVIVVSVIAPAGFGYQPPLARVDLDEGANLADGHYLVLGPCPLVDARLLPRPVGQREPEGDAQLGARAVLADVAAQPESAVNALGLPFTAIAGCAASDRPHSIPQATTHLVALCRGRHA